MMIYFEGKCGFESRWIDEIDISKNNEVAMVFICGDGFDGTQPL